MIDDVMQWLVVTDEGRRWMGCMPLVRPLIGPTSHWSDLVGLMRRPIGPTDDSTTGDARLLRTDSTTGDARLLRTASPA